ncbi:transcriptional regulator [Phenylobacterium sp.]|jgi:DNA-binding MarR family transcriptional regulator|uniref:winged helix-turn-helix domain-containing protein n=1 Tax=Phenylobacterium sp. TaxID=1871053 RepID=UPI002F948FEE
MAEADEIIHQSTRLKIMSVLNALPEDEALEFKRLKAISQATDGNLGAHLATLEKAGYVAIEKDFVGKKPRTRAQITRAGRKAYAAHLQYLKAIIEGGSAEG